MNNLLRDQRWPLLFLHIPKTSGTAFYNYISLHFETDRIAPFIMKVGPETFLSKKYHFFYGHFYFNELSHLTTKPILLTFLRNPIRRVISQYRHLQTEANLSNWKDVISKENMEALEFTQKATFEEYIFSDNPFVMQSITDLQTQYLSGEKLNSPNLYESAAENLLTKFSFFGITEYFSQSINLFKRYFTDAKAYDLPISHERRSIHPMPDVSMKSYHRILELNQKDIRLYELAVNELMVRCKNI